MKEFLPCKISEEDFINGERLDAFLARKFPEYSRSQWTDLLKKKLILVNSIEAKASSKAKVGDLFSWSKEFLEEKKKKTSLQDTEIVFRGPEPKIIEETKDWLVLMKPAGLTVHPGRGRPLEETLVAWLIQQNKIDRDRMKDWSEDILEEERPGIVHRLDHETSGIMIVAKNVKTHAKLSSQFEKREAGRFYHALIRGKMSSLLTARPREFQKKLQEVPCTMAFKMNKSGEGSLATYLSRDPKNRVRFHVGNSQGKRAVTHFKTLSYKEPFSWVELQLETGRTHQIRVHLSFLGFPIVGDPLYGGEAADRMWLHAHTLYFVDPASSKKLKFNAPLPEGDAKLLKTKYSIKLESEEA